MPKHVKLRTLTEEESQAVKGLAASRTAPQRSVQRAKIIVAMLQDGALKASDAGLRAGYKSRQVGPQWVKRFNAEGLAGPFTFTPYFRLLARHKFGARISLLMR